MGPGSWTCPLKPRRGLGGQGHDFEVQRRSRTRGLATDRAAPLFAFGAAERRRRGLDREAVRGVRCAASRARRRREVLFTAQPRRARRHRGGGRVPRTDDGTDARFESAAGAASGSLQAPGRCGHWPGAAPFPLVWSRSTAPLECAPPCARPQRLIPLVGPLGFSPTSFPSTRRPDNCCAARPRRPFACLLACPTAAPDAVASTP